MPMSIDELDQTYRRAYRRLITAVLVIYGAGFLVVFTLLMSNPRIASWINQATEAELAISTPSPEPAPTLLAQPNRPTQTVRTD